MRRLIVDVLSTVLSRIIRLTSIVQGLLTGVPERNIRRGYVLRLLYLKWRLEARDK